MKFSKSQKIWIISKLDRFFLRVEAFKLKNSRNNSIRDIKQILNFNKSMDKLHVWNHNRQELILIILYIFKQNNLYQYNIIYLIENYYYLIILKV